MTREVAIKFGKTILIFAIQEKDLHTYEFTKMAVEALSTKESDDCISREDAKEAIRRKFKDLPNRCEINEVLNSLPSVQPKPKYVAVGNVNFDKDELQKIVDEAIPTIMPEIEYIKAHWQNNACSNCGIYNASAYKNWCPNCGAKMFEPQERSDKE